MKNFFKGKFATVVILLLTVILAGVAIFTALRLYQLRNQAVAPNVPSSIPKAAEICGGVAGTLCPSGTTCIYSNGTTHATTPDESGTCVSSAARSTAVSSCSTLAFTLGSGSPTPPGSPTATPTGTPGGTPTATPTGTLGPSGTPNACGGTCGSNANCGNGLMCYQGFCRNQSCVTSTNCVCAGTPAPTQPALPNSGTGWPTVAGAGLGIIVILGSLLLAL